MTAVERLGAYHVIRALDSGGPADPQPGQFYMLSTAERWGGGADERPYLPRAFSYARAREGELSFLLEVVGPGTARLAELRAGEGLALVGPLGDRAGGRRATGDAPLLVGGGIGTAPLLCWQDELGAGGRRSCSAFAPPSTRRRPRCSPAARRSPPTTAPPGGRRSSRTCCASSSTPTPRRRSTPAARRRCWRRSGRSARRSGCPPSWRWSRGWRAASGPASAASCRPGRATSGCASTAPSWTPTS